jgi:hypothetical protein
MQHFVERQYHGRPAYVHDVRAMARALGGEVAGRDTVVAPGPGHSRRDRSLSVRKDYVRERLGRRPAWEPRDGCDRRVALARVEEFDRTVVDAECDQRRAWTEDELIRIARASAIWN